MDCQGEGPHPMTPKDIAHYRSLIETHARMKDPLVVIKVADLRALLDCYEWSVDTKPRIRRAAVSEGR